MYQDNWSDFISASPACEHIHHPRPAVTDHGNVTVSASVPTAAFRMMSLIPNSSVIRVTGQPVGVRLTAASDSFLFGREEFVSSHHRDLG